MFRLFDICSVFFWHFDLSIFLLPLKLFDFCTWGCSCTPEKASGKNSKSQKVTSILFDFSTFPLFFFPFTFRFFGFSVFLLPFTLFEFRTQGWAFTPEKASGKNSKSQKVKSILFDFSTVLLLSKLFDFRTSGCTCLAGKGSGKNSKDQSVKSILLDFSVVLFPFSCLTFVLKI